MLLLNGNETERPYRVAPLGLAYVASALQASGREVRFLDLLQTRTGYAQFLSLLRTWRPQVIGIGIRNLDNSDFHAFHTYLDLPKRLAKAIRHHLPEARIVLGGSAPTVDPALVIREIEADHLILGEGEEAFLALIEALEQGQHPARILGALGSTNPFRVTDTQSLPAPRLSEWTSMRPYLRGDAGYPLQTKRGCPLRCSYCTYGRIEGVRYRLLNPEAVADEVEGAMAMGIRDFEFVDSTFNLPPKHAISVVRTLKARGLYANYHGTGLNPSRIPNDLLDGMREIGFRQVILTAESASETMLRSYAKNYTVNALYTAAESLRRAGLGVLWVFLLGGPGETTETVEETLHFIASTVRAPDAVYITSGIRIYPGSPMGDTYQEGRFSAQDLRNVAGSPSTPFYYSSETPPSWLEARLRSFCHQHPNVMLSCEGHERWTEWALRLIPYTGLKKPYWQYLWLLNRLKRAGSSVFRNVPLPSRMFKAMKPL